MKRLVFALILFVSACTPVASNYRELAAKVVPTNVELIGTFYNLNTGEVREDAAYCSGVVISRERVITAGHCVDAAKTMPAQAGVTLFDGMMKLRLYDGRIVFAKIVVYENIDGPTADVARDIALLEFVTPINTPVATLGDSDTVQVGDQVAIVGNTYGLFAHTFTVGVVSFVNRTLEVGTFIQTDAHSAGGNSGGGVYDMDGKLIGILTRGADGTLSLVLPINDVIKHIHGAINNKKPA